MMKFKVRLQCSGLDDIYKTHVLENIVLEIILYLVHVHTIAQVVSQYTIHISEV